MMVKCAKIDHHLMSQNDDPLARPSFSTCRQIDHLAKNDVSRNIFYLCMINKTHTSCDVNYNLFISQ